MKPIFVPKPIKAIIIILVGTCFAILLCRCTHLEHKPSPPPFPVCTGYLPKNCTERAVRLAVIAQEHGFNAEIWQGLHKSGNRHSVGMGEWKSKWYMFDRQLPLETVDKRLNISEAVQDRMSDLLQIWGSNNLRASE